MCGVMRAIKRFAGFCLGASSLTGKTQTTTFQSRFRDFLFQPRFSNLATDSIFRTLPRLFSLHQAISNRLDVVFRRTYIRDANRACSGFIIQCGIFIRGIPLRLLFSRLINNLKLPGFTNSKFRLSVPWFPFKHHREIILRDERPHDTRRTSFITRRFTT